MLMWKTEVLFNIHVKPLIILEGNIHDLFWDQDITSQNHDFPFISISSYLEHIVDSPDWQQITHVDFSNGLIRSKNDSSTSQKDSPSYISQSIDSNLLASLCQNIETQLFQTNPSVFIFHYGTLRYIQETDHSIFRQFCYAMRRIVSEQLMMRPNHSIIWLCDSLNDIPNILFDQNPYAYVIPIPFPCREYRKMLLKSMILSNESSKSEKNNYLCDRLVFFTEGFTTREMILLNQIRKTHSQTITKPEELLHAFRFGSRKNPWFHLSHDDLASAYQKISRRVFGQKEIIVSVVDLIKRATLRMSDLSIQNDWFCKSRASLFLAGPAGTGKLELGKAIAEFIFGDDHHCVHFNMGDYATDYADQKLFGVKGKQPGELLSLVYSNPFLVLVFEEIERAHSKVLDQLLRILQHGCLNDHLGRPVFFSETFIICTSHIGSAKGKIGDKKYDFNENGFTPKYDIVKQLIRRSVEDHFKLKMGRGEFLHCFGNHILIFDFIRPEILQNLIYKIIGILKTVIYQRVNVQVSVSEEVVTQLLEYSHKTDINSVRSLVHMIDMILINPLIRYVIEDSIQPESHLHIIKIKPTIPNQDILFDIVIDTNWVSDETDDLSIDI